MTPAVLEGSVVVGWFFADQASAEGDLMLDYIRDYGAVVPGSWALEIANIMLEAQKRHLILPIDAAVRLDLLSALPIMVDQNTAGRAWSEIMDIASAEGLTMYDAAYLELAVRRSLPLFTRHEPLRAAAQRRHVRLSVS